MKRNIVNCIDTQSKLLRLNNDHFAQNNKFTKLLREILV